MLDLFTAVIFALVLLEVMAGIMLVGWLVQARHHNGLIGWALAHAGAAVLIALAWLYDATLISSLLGSVLAVLGLTLAAIVPGTVYLLFRMLRAEEQTYGAYRRDTADKFLASLDPLRVQRLEYDLRQALKLPDKHFVVVFQPYFHVRDRKLAGFEALLRWKHPVFGDIPPDEFISLAERSGLIVPLGKWALEAACQQASGWHKPWAVSVNVSPVQLMKRQFVRQLQGILARSALAPERLQLEVTEGVMIDARNRAREVLTEVAAAGVRIALDDFGTGYAHLRYLNRMPCHTVKIDRSFVADLTHDPAARRVTAALIGLAQDLGHDTVAEGVESEEQLQVLEELGCHKAQGYLLGRPMLASEVVTVFADDEIYEADRDSAPGGAAGKRKPSDASTPLTEPATSNGKPLAPSIEST